MNIARVAAMTEEGRMRPPGLVAFAARLPEKSAVYAYEPATPATLGDAYERRLRSNTKAWAFWESQPPYYRRVVTRWVVSAKQEATRERRLATLIADCAAGRRIGPMRRSED